MSNGRQIPVSYLVDLLGGIVNLNMQTSICRGFKHTTATISNLS
jgi:hypothetical protein